MGQRCCQTWAGSLIRCDADLGVVGVQKLRGTDEGADDACVAHGSQHLAGQALRLGALRAARGLGRARRQQGACQLHESFHLCR